jgi:probable HAF family extracellular repeat protein
MGQLTFYRSTLFVFTLACIAGSIKAQSFTGLGTLGGDFSSALAISGNGNVVVGISRNSAGFAQAFRWDTTSGIQSLIPTGTHSSAIGVSQDGENILGGSTTMPRGPFRWSDGLAHKLKVFPGATGGASAKGISDDGAWIVGSSSWRGPGNRAARWSGGGEISHLGVLPTGDDLEFSFANGISGNGSVIVGTSSSIIGRQGFVWTEANGMVGVGTLTSRTTQSDARAVSQDGLAVVGDVLDAGRRKAFLWTSLGGMEEIVDSNPMVNRHKGNAVNGDGTVIGGSRGYGAIDEAFIWTRLDGVRSVSSILTNDYGLNIDGWELSTVTGISDDGDVITGFGFDPQGQQQAWVAVVPAPSIATLLVAAGFVSQKRNRYP